MEDELEDQELEEEEEEEEETPSEKLYAGKYKTPEEMERAYLEAQSAMTRAQQEKAELERQYSQSGAVSPPGYTEDWATEMNSKFLDDPMATLGQVLGMYEASRNAIESNIENALVSHETDPNYRDVQSKYRAKLKERATELADPVRGKAIADSIYKEVAYDHMMSMINKTKEEDPAGRLAALKALGVEQPEPAEGPYPGTELTRGQREILNQFTSLSKEAKQKVIDRVRSKREE